MFDIGFFELLVTLLVGLVVVGPGKLPQLLRQLGIWKREASSAYYNLKWKIEQEVTPDDQTRIQNLRASEKTKNQTVDTEANQSKSTQKPS